MRDILSILSSKFSIPVCVLGGKYSKEYKMSSFVPKMECYKGLFLTKTKHTKTKKIGIMTACLALKVGINESGF